MNRWVLYDVAIWLSDYITKIQEDLRQDICMVVYLCLYVTMCLCVCVFVCLCICVFMYFYVCVFLCLYICGFVYLSKYVV